MTETFQAGSIHSALKVEIESLEKGLSSAGKHLDAFGDQTAKTAQNVDAAGAGISKTFDRLAAKSTAFANEFQVRWTKNQGAVTSATRAITNATSDMGVKFDLINRQNARLAQDFQQRWRQTATEVGGAGVQATKTGTAFGELDRSTLKQTERFSRLTNRLIGVQFAMQSLQGESTRGGKALEVATRGLGIFASTALLIPGPVGIAAGAFLGLSVAFQAATAAGKDATEALKNAKAAVEGFKSGQREREFQGKVADRLKKVFPDQEDIQLMTKAADQIALIRRITTEQVAIEEELTDLHKQRAEINKTLEDPTLGLGIIKQIIPGFMEVKMKQLTGELAAIDKQIQQLQRNSPRVAKDLKDAVEPLDRLRMNEALKDIQKMSDEFNKQTDDLKFQRTVLPEFVAIQRQRLEVEQKIGEASKGIKDQTALDQARLQRERVRDLAVKRASELAAQGEIKMQEELRKTAALMKEQIDPLTRLQEVEKLREETIKEIVKLRKSELFVIGATIPDEELKAAAEKRSKEHVEQLRQLANRQDFKDAFAQPVSEGVFNGLADAMLNAGEAFKPLQVIGENLFSSMVNSFSTQLQKQLTSALTSAFGAGGTALGNLFTGVLGIVGLFMSRGKSSSSQSFDNVSSRVESTQAVRGLVAGPTSIPIAAVAPDLRRALGPSERWLEIIAGNTGRIARLIGSGGSRGSGLAGGFQFAGSVPTSS